MDIESAAGRQPGEPTEIHWMPKWIVEVAPNMKVGVATDDGCYVVLVRAEGGWWSPTKWIPKEAAIFIGDLARSHR